MKNRKPTPNRFTYGGLSTLRADADQQVLVLAGDKGRSGDEPGPSADLTIHDPIQLREALSTLMQIVKKGFGYAPSTPEHAALVQESYEAWKTAAPNLSPIESRRRFHAFMSSADPDAWLVMDPVVTIHEDAIVFEVFDKRGRMYGAMTLRGSAYSGTVRPGTLHVEAGQELLDGLALLHSRSPVRLLIGADAPSELEDRYQGELVKSFVYPHLWLRQLLQVQAAATLPVRRAPLSRVDLFNLLRYLRLNKESKGQDRALRFALVPGESPEMTLEPWEWRYRCTGPAYSGAQSEILGIWDRREPMVLNRLLPYVRSAEVQILGEAQPTFWSLDCGDFTFTLATPGFRAANWSRGLMIDINLPRHTAAPEGYDRYLAAITEAGITDHATAASAASLDAESALQSLRRAVQNGQVFHDPGTGLIAGRQLFAEGLDEAAMQYRSGQEGKAWCLVDQGRVHKQMTIRPTGEIDFTAAPDAANPGGIPSRVTEAKHPFQEREPVFTPKLEINRAGATRKPGCTCTFWKRQQAGTKEPCAHIQALWLQHCMDVAEEKRMASIDPSRIKVRNGTFVKRQPDAEEVHEISLMFKRLTEVWGTREQLRDKRGRRQVLIFSSVADARTAFFTRCVELEQKGYLNASK
jgi:hypothetical protein